jgi:hypothetical protein
MKDGKAASTMAAPSIKGDSDAYSQAGSQTYPGKT